MRWGQELTKESAFHTQLRDFTIFHLYLNTSCVCTLSSCLPFEYSSANQSGSPFPWSFSVSRDLSFKEQSGRYLLKKKNHLLLLKVSLLFTVAFRIKLKPLKYPLECRNPSLDSALHLYFYYFSPQSLCTCCFLLSERFSLLLFKYLSLGPLSDLSSGVTSLVRPFQFRFTSHFIFFSICFLVPCLSYLLDYRFPVIGIIWLLFIALPPGQAWYYWVVVNIQ